MTKFQIPTKIVIGVLIAAMLVLSLLFLQWSGLVRLKPVELKPVAVNGANFPSLQTLSLNRVGNQLFKAQSYKAAFESYVQALQYDPFAAELHLNIGLGYEVEQQADKAELSYKNANRYAQNGLVKFMALFNEAQLNGKAKKYDEALNLYQQALVLNPASKEVKTNIELLIEQQQQEQKQQDNKDNKDNKDDKKDQKDNKDQKDSKDPKDSKDNKDDKKQDPKKDPKDDKNKDKDKDKDKDKKDDPKKDPKEDKKDPKDDKKDSDKDKDKEKEKDQPKQPAPNQKYQPRPFNGKELSEADVKKILGEIKQQEQKIRSEFNRKDVKEQPRDKDW